MPPTHAKMSKQGPANNVYMLINCVCVCVRERERERERERNIPQWPDHIRSITFNSSCPILRGTMKTGIFTEKNVINL